MPAEGSARESGVYGECWWVFRREWPARFIVGRDPRRGNGSEGQKTTPCKVLQEEGRTNRDIEDTGWDSDPRAWSGFRPSCANDGRGWQGDLPSPRGGIQPQALPQTADCSVRLDSECHLPTQGERRWAAPGRGDLLTAQWFLGCPSSPPIPKS